VISLARIRIHKYTKDGFSSLRRKKKVRRDEKPSFVYLFCCKNLFVAQIKITRGTFICAQIEICEYTNRIFSVDVEHNYSHTTFISLFPLPPHLLRLGHFRRRRRHPPPSLLLPSPSPPSPVSARRRCRRCICRRLGHCWRRATVSAAAVSVDAVAAVAAAAPPR
jgi:hypothetical protein